MTYIAMFDDAKQLAKFVSAKNMINFVDIGEWLGSFAATFTLDGATADEVKARIYSLDGTMVSPE